MRIITIDNGNTNPHVGIFQNEKLLQVIPLKDFIPINDDFILISDVGKTLSICPTIDLKSKRKNHVFFNMPFNYTETLGDDRLISAHYLFEQLQSNENILIIDAGTFITMDLINHSGFQGGYIFPGLQTFLGSYQTGSHLPDLKLKAPLALTTLPHSTEEAILGATDIFLDAILEKIIKRTSPAKIMLTGGSADLMKKKIEKFNLEKVQLEKDPHLIHSALFAIYQNHLRPK